MLQSTLNFRSCFRTLFRSLTALTTLFAGLMPNALACTRAVYLGQENLVITRRTMDWFNDMASNLWAFPRGIERDGAAGAKLKYETQHQHGLRSANPSYVYFRLATYLACFTNCVYEIQQSDNPLPQE